MTPNVTSQSSGQPAHPMMTAAIETFVRAPLVSVGSQATLRTATRSMLLHDVGAIAVMDEGNLTGILTEHDVARAVAAGADPDAALVGAWTTCAPLSAHPDDRIVDTAITMLHNRLRCLPVFGRHGERIGYVRLDEIQLPVLHAEEAPHDRRPYMPPD
jgi:CBS domain-containing protein